MAKGVIESAGEKFSRTHAEDIQRLKDQLLICLVKRAGGKVELPAAEVDDTGQDILDLQVEHESRVFTLTARKKS